MPRIRYHSMKKIALLFSMIFLFAFGKEAGKKQQIISISKKYFPENNPLLTEYDEATINSLAEGKTIKEYVYEIPTVVHEAYHSYMGKHSSYYDSAIRYRISDAIYFDVPFFKTYQAIELNNFIPNEWQKKITRYDTYINSRQKYLVTQQFGILGLLEESCAYYQSMRTSLALFGFLKDTYGFKDPEIWIEYLGSIGSYRYALNEFALFTSWYLQYAKLKHADVYKSMVTNKGLKKLFSFLRKSNAGFNELYNQQREEIMTQLGSKVNIEGDYIFNTKTLAGKGLYDKDHAALEAALAGPDHKILGVLKDE